MRRLILVAAALTSCQVSRHAERGDEAMAKGNHAAALSSYLAALDGASEGDWDVERKKNVAAVVVARKRVEQAERRAEAGDENTPIQLWAVAVAKGWGAPAAEEMALQSLSKIYEKRLAKQARDAAEGRFEDAARFADEARAVLGLGDPVSQRAAAVVTELAARIAASAEGVPRGARWFRLALAERYGAMVDAAKLEAARPAEVGFAVTGTANPSCVPYVPATKPSGSREDARTVVTWVLDSCSAGMTETASEEAYRHPKTTATTRTSEVARYVRKPRDPACEKPAPCRRYDPLGVCVERDEPEGCEDTVRVLETVPTTVVDYETETVTAKRIVHERRYAAFVRGKVRVRRGDQGTEMPLEVDVVLTDRAWWTPFGQKHFTKRSLVDVIRRAQRDVTAKIDAAAREAIAASAKRVVARDDPNLAPDEREHRFVVEALGTGRLSDAGAAFLGKRYGLGRVAAEEVLRRRGRRAANLVPPKQSLPAPRSKSWEDRWESRIVSAEPDDWERPQNRWSGMDVAFGVEGTPLPSSSWLAAPRLRFRTKDVRLELSAASESLVGEAGGFSADLAFHLDDLPFDDLYLTLGARFESSQNDEDERTRFLGVPVTISLPLDATTLWISGGVNLWTLEELADDDPDDPAFVWPLSVGATIDLWSRFYAKGRVTHYLFSDDDAPLYVGGELGVRL